MNTPIFILFFILIIVLCLLLVLNTSNKFKSGGAGPDGEPEPPHSSDYAEYAVYDKPHDLSTHTNPLARKFSPPYVQLEDHFTPQASQDREFRIRETIDENHHDIEIKLNEARSSVIPFEQIQANGEPDMEQLVELYRILSDNIAKYKYMLSIPTSSIYAMRQLISEHIHFLEQSLAELKQIRNGIIQFKKNHKQIMEEGV